MILPATAHKDCTLQGDVSTEFLISSHRPRYVLQMFSVTIITEEAKSVHCKMYTVKKMGNRVLGKTIHTYFGHFFTHLWVKIAVG